MPTLYEYYNAGDDDYTIVHPGAAYYRGQTFTPAISHTITSAKLKLYKVGNPGNLTVEIRAVSDNSVLCSGTYAVAGLGASPGAFVEITLGVGAALTASTVYRIVTYTASGDGSNYVGWRVDGSSPTYAGGSHCYSSDAITWTDYTPVDNMFEEYGPDLKTVGGGSLAIAGAVAKVSIFSQLVGQAAIAIAGLLSSIWKQVVGQGTIALAGTLVSIRTAFQVVGEATIAIVGTLITVKIFLQNVGQGLIAIAGTLTSIRTAFQNVGGGAITIAGTTLIGLLRWLKLKLFSKGFRRLTLKSEPYRELKLQSEAYRRLVLQTQGGEDGMNRYYFGATPYLYCEVYSQAGALTDPTTSIVVSVYDPNKKAVVTNSDMTTTGTTGKYYYASLTLTSGTHLPGKYVWRPKVTDGTIVTIAFEDEFELAGE